MARLLITVLVVLCLAGCATNASRMTDISNGMTREEVVQSLGTPASVNAQGNQVLLIYTMFNGWSAYTWQSNYYVLLRNDHVVSFGNVKDSSVTPNDQGNFSYVLQPSESSQQSAPATTAGASASSPAAPTDTQPNGISSPSVGAVAAAQTSSSSTPALPSASSSPDNSVSQSSVNVGQSVALKEFADKLSRAASEDGDISTMTGTSLVSVEAIQMASRVINPAVSSLMVGSQSTGESNTASSPEDASGSDANVSLQSTQSAQQVVSSPGARSADAQQGASSAGADSKCSSFGSYSFCDSDK